MRISGADTAWWSGPKLGRYSGRSTGRPAGLHGRGTDRWAREQRQLTLHKSAQSALSAQTCIASPLCTVSAQSARSAPNQSRTERRLQPAGPAAFGQMPSHAVLPGWSSAVFAAGFCQAGISTGQPGRPPPARANGAGGRVAMPLQGAVAPRKASDWHPRRRCPPFLQAVQGGRGPLAQRSDRTDPWCQCGGEVAHRAQSCPGL